MTTPPPRGLPDRRSGHHWLVVGGIGVAVYVVVLALLSTVAPGIAWPVLVLDVLLYAAMVIVRFAVDRVVRTQSTLAACFLAASALSLAAVVLIGALRR